MEIKYLEDSDTEKTDPANETAYDKAMKQIKEEAFLKTFPGKIFSFLRQKGERENVETSFEEQPYGRTIFHFGHETATLQAHVENTGFARSYTPITDLQKPWWREAFLEYGEGGHIENVGLISPSIYECIAKNFPEEAEKFRIDNILRTIGIDPQNQEEEYVENDIYGTPKQASTGALMGKIENFWNSLVAPNFSVQFNNGNGDLWRKLRLIPVNRQGQEALMSGGTELQKPLREIIDQYDNLIAAIK